MLPSTSSALRDGSKANSSLNRPSRPRSSGRPGMGGRRWGPRLSPSGPRTLVSDSQSVVPRSCGIFVEADEVTERHRKRRVVAGAEGIDAERVLETRDDDREAQRVEPGIEKYEVVRQRRERLLLLGRDVLELGEDL